MTHFLSPSLLLSCLRAKALIYCAFCTAALPSVLQFGKPRLNVPQAMQRNPSSLPSTRRRKTGRALGKHRRGQMQSPGDATFEVGQGGRLCLRCARYGWKPRGQLRTSEFLGPSGLPPILEFIENCQEFGTGTVSIGRILTVPKSPEMLDGFEHLGGCANDWDMGSVLRCQRPREEDNNLHSPPASSFCGFWPSPRGVRRHRLFLLTHPQATPPQGHGRQNHRLLASCVGPRT